MKNIVFLSLILIFLPRRLFAQRIIDLSYAEDMQGNYNFSCNNKAYCNYILEIGFTSLDNATCDHSLPYRAVVKPGMNKLFKLSKQRPDDPVQFKYKIGYFKGCLDPKVDTGFTYLLPVSPGKSTQAYELGTLPKQNAGDPQAKNVYAIRLRMKPGDTIFAARRGTVTEMDVSSNLNDSGVVSAHSDNYIEIVQGDCSFAHYGIIKRNGSFVKPGQEVEAGQPIGLVCGDKYGRGAEIRFDVYYNQTIDQGSVSGNGMGSADIYWVYVPLKFWTKKNGKGMLKHGGTYTSEWPKAIVAQEIKSSPPHHPRKAHAS